MQSADSQPHTRQASETLALRQRRCTMRVPVFCLLGLLVAGVNSATLAQTKFDAQVRAKTIAPFVDEQTIGVAHVDLSRVDLDRLLKQAAELAPGVDKTLAPAIEHFRPMAKHLVES